MKKENACITVSNFFDYPKFQEKGICRITGEESEGLNFSKWVKKTFTDYSYLKEGTIISNEALFCFEEKNKPLTEFLGKENLQKLRSYSIIVTDKIHLVTKADKAKITYLLQENPQIVCLAESGQKHILFKHKIGFWQLEETNDIKPNLELFNKIMQTAQELLELGFSQTEIISGQYIQNRILKADIKVWKNLEDILKEYRGSKIFDFTTFLLHKKEL